MARESGGSFVLRVEDLDRPRVVPGAERAILDDLEWLGLAWDEGPRAGGPHAPYRQSERTSHYESALAKLTALGLTYPCDCSRAEIARSASAPHAGEETVYPGTCSEKDPERPFRRDPAIRLRTGGAGILTVEDGVLGPLRQEVCRDVGDFVLRRGDGIFAYQLAVVVDDLAMGITDVVRGADLLSSTPRQIVLARMLGGQEPRYWHLPLVTASNGERLAKRTPGARVRDLRDRGLTPETLRERLSDALGLARVGERRWRREPWPIPDEWAV